MITNYYKQTVFLKQAKLKKNIILTNNLTHILRTIEA